jgi:hypothetical protein
MLIKDFRQPKLLVLAHCALYPCWPTVSTTSASNDSATAATTLRKIILKNPSLLLHGHTTRNLLSVAAYAAIPCHAIPPHPKNTLHHSNRALPLT